MRLTYKFLHVDALFPFEDICVSQVSGVGSFIRLPARSGSQVGESYRKTPDHLGTWMSQNESIMLTCQTKTFLFQRGFC